MDFPIFHLDLMGNRMLVAVIATVHVWINHALAVGFIPLVAVLEYFAFRTRAADPARADSLDRLARRMLGVAFVVTTSLGALTGVGIWFSASLVNPAAIGSLIRVFYGAWFTEWIVFVLEVVFLMAWYLLWDRAAASDEAKRRHVAAGALLSLFSWLTMAIIVAILGFQMDPGSWLERRTFLSGFANPLYIPQLYFRTALAMSMGGAFGLLLAPLFLRRDDPARPAAVRCIALWTLVWAPVALVGGVLYRSAIPEALTASFPVAVATLAFQQWYDSLLTVIVGAVVVAVLIAAWAFLRPRLVPRAVAVFPIIALFLFLGTFERVREFVRKPFVIGGYMYANGLRVEDYPLYQRDGLLRHAAFAAVREVTPGNRVRAGGEVFLQACSRCHTVGGLNSVVTKFRNLAGPGQPLQAALVRDYIPRMHKAWYYMPPFPGSAAEADALTEYILHADRSAVRAEGAQDRGLPGEPPAWPDSESTGGTRP